MGYCSDQLPILDDRASAHPLHNAPGLIDQALICHPEGNSAVRICGFKIDGCNFDAVGCAPAI